MLQRVIIINRGRVELDQKMAELVTQSEVVELEARGPAEQMTNVLRTTDGVERIESRHMEDGVTAFTVWPRAGSDLRETLFQRIAKNGWSLRRLDRKRRTLDELFQQVVVRGVVDRPEPARVDSANGVEEASSGVDS